jgi:phosphatidylinositol alpha-1,6-mannosyltransferase
LALESDAETCIVCCHLHLAPVARAIAWRAWRGLGPMRGSRAWDPLGPTRDPSNVPPGSGSVRVTYILCGIEAWVPVRPSERWALAAGRLVAISSHTAQRFKAANPDFAAAHVEICRPGLPAASNGTSPEASMGGVIAPRPCALIVGRMARDEGYKGHEQLIDLWPRVQQRCPDARLWVVGDGDDRPRLEALARARGVDGPITFTGRISDAALGELYRKCRFFVLPSRDEGFGLVFLEAMREGKACIGARGAAEEIISHQSTGLIVDPARPDELYAALVRLFEDPATCDAFGEAGRARFAAVFTDAHFRSRFAPLLSDEEYEETHAQVR